MAEQQVQSTEVEISFFSSNIKEASVVQLVSESVVWNEAREVDRDPATKALWTMVRTLSWVST